MDEETVPLKTADEVPLTATPVPETDAGNQTVESNERFVSMVAPSSLPEGSTFVVELPDGRSFEVQVGEGGFKEGSQMIVPFPTTFLSDSSRRGQWKYGLCDCLDLICHPIFWCAYCCPFLSIGQLMTRMRLDWCGHPTTHENAEYTCCALLAIQFLAYLLHRTIICPFFLIYRVSVIVMTRRKVRARYGIEEEEDCGDLGYSFWCPCCTIIQMERQTSDETHQGLCCSPTDLPDTSPALEP